MYILIHTYILYILYMNIAIHTHIHLHIRVHIHISTPQNCAVHTTCYPAIAATATTAARPL